MKTKNEVIPVRVYRNELHEANTKRELQTAQTALNSVLRVWNELELTPCNDIVKLITNPEKCYSESIDLSVSVPIQPGAKYQISKDIYIKSLQIPIPDSLYRACREARKLPFTNMPELWIIEGDKVVMNETEAETLINSQNIYITTDEQKKRAEDILKYIELTNMLAEKFPSDFLLQTPSANNFFGNGKFHITQRSYPGPYTLEIIPNKLREWLQG